MEYNTFFTHDEVSLYKEKREIRKAAGKVGLSLLSLFVIMSGWSFVFLRLMGNLGFDRNYVLKLTENPIVNELLQISVSIIMFVIPTFLLLRITHSKLRDFDIFKGPALKSKAVFPAALGFCLLASQLNNVFSNVFASFGITFPSMDRELPEGVIGFLLVLISTTAFPALLEELLMRGAVLGVLRKFGDSFAIVASSLLFAFMHASLIQFPFAFLVGLILGFVTVKTNSIWPAVIIHAMNNFVSVVFSFLNETLNKGTANIIFSLFLIVLFAISAVSIAMVSKDKEFLKVEIAQTTATESKKIGWFLSTPWIIVSFCVALAFAIFLR